MRLIVCETAKSYDQVEIILIKHGIVIAAKQQPTYHQTRSSLPQEFRSLISGFYAKAPLTVAVQGLSAQCMIELHKTDCFVSGVWNWNPAFGAVIKHCRQNIYSHLDATKHRIDLEIATSAEMQQQKRVALLAQELVNLCDALQEMDTDAAAMDLHFYQYRRAAAQQALATIKC